MLLGIVDKLNDLVKPFKDFVDTNHGNHLMWLAFVVIGLAVFFMTYGALHKDS